MAKQTINIGASPNDGTGTPLRTSFDYCNQNFTELYTATGPSGNNIVVPGSATITGDLTAARLNVTGATIPANGVYLASANNLTFAFNSTLGMSLNAGGLLVNNTTGFNTVANIKLKLGGRFLSGISGVGAYSFGTADAGGFVINDAGDGSTENRLLTLNSTGLGVGATPSATLDIRKNASGSRFLSYHTGGNGTVTAGADLNEMRCDDTTTAYNLLNVNVLGTSRFLITSSGNVGVGVTPSAWGNQYRALQIFNNSALYGANSYGYYGLLFNGYNDNTNIKAIASLYVGEYRYELSTGAHKWFGTTANATAGATATPTQAMTLDASGRLLVGQTSAGLTNADSITLEAGSVGGGAYCVVNHKSGTASGQQYVFFGYNGVKTGDITQNGTTGVLYNTVSDYRLKESVQPLVGGLARVNALKPSIYKWKSDGSNGEGFLAHELAEVIPTAVTGEKDAVNEDGSIKTQSVDLSRVVPILVAAIKELTARVEALEA